MVLSSLKENEKYFNHIGRKHKHNLCMYWTQSQEYVKADDFDVSQIYKYKYIYIIYISIYIYIIYIYIYYIYIIYKYI